MPLHDPGDYVILLHPAYKYADEALPLPAREVPVGAHDAEDELRPPAPQPRGRAGMVRADYQDPAGVRHAAYRGRWLAAFAPVGNTELVVIVQQPGDGAADEAGGAWSGWSWLWLGAGAILAAGLIGTALRRLRRRRTALPARPADEMTVTRIEEVGPPSP